MPNRNVWIEQYKRNWQTANTPTPRPSVTPSPTPFTPWKSGASLNPLAAGRSLENMPVSTFTPYTETASDKAAPYSVWKQTGIPRLPESQSPLSPGMDTQEIKIRKAYDLATKAYDASTGSGIDPSISYETFKTKLMAQADPEAELKWFFDTYEPTSGTTASGGTSSSGATKGTSNSNPWSNPYSDYYAKSGVDPSWVSSFQQQHKGNDPITQYLSGNNPGAPESTGQALFQADQDKQWGERFARTYGRPPSEDDWKASYWDRVSGYGHTNQATGGGW